MKSSKLNNWPYLTYFISQDYPFHCRANSYPHRGLDEPRNASLSKTGTLVGKENAESYINGLNAGYGIGDGCGFDDGCGNGYGSGNDCR